MTITPKKPRKSPTNARRALALLNERRELTDIEKATILRFAPALLHLGLICADAEQKHGFSTTAEGRKYL